MTLQFNKFFLVRDVLKAYQKCAHQKICQITACDIQKTGGNGSKWPVMIITGHFEPLPAVLWHKSHIIKQITQIVVYYEYQRNDHYWSFWTITDSFVTLLLWFDNFFWKFLQFFLFFFKKNSLNHNTHLKEYHYRKFWTITVIVTIWMPFHFLWMFLYKSKSIMTTKGMSLMARGYKGNGKLLASILVVGKRIPKYEDKVWVFGNPLSYYIYQFLLIAYTFSAILCIDAWSAAITTIIWTAFIVGIIMAITITNLPRVISHTTCKQKNNN